MATATLTAEAAAMMGEQSAPDSASVAPSKRMVRFTPTERVQFTSQLAMMTEAGVAVSSAMQSLIRQCHRPALAEVLERIDEDVLGGSSFSVALQRHPGLFNEAYVATISAGEASGKMSEVLAQLAEMQRAELRIHRSLRGMLVYPVLLTLVSLVVVTTLIIFVLPRFSSIFEQYDLALPMVTQFLIGISTEASGRWWLWGPLAAGLAGLLYASRGSAIGRQWTDTAALKTPGVQNVMKTLIGARACRMLGLLVMSGVPLMDCLKLLRKAISNYEFRQLTHHLEEGLTNGRSLSDSLNGNEVLPGSASEMIATAEKTGRLGEVCAMMGCHYEEEGEAAARQLVSAIEPVVTIVMGAVVAVVVLAVMLPVFDIASLAH